MTRGPGMHGDKSIESGVYGNQLTQINRGRRKADIDYMLMLKWARNGFVSVPGNLGPVDGDGGSWD